MFKRFTLVLAVCLTSLGLVACSGSSTPSTSKTPTAAISPVDAWAPIKGQPLATPPEIHSENGVLNATLHVTQQTVNVSGSPVENIKAYNGGFGAPTLVVNPGDTIELDLVNDLSEVTNLHFHGFHVSPNGESDNIFRHVMPGQTAHYEVKIPKNHEVGLFWYHSHAHGISEEQVHAGLSGLIEIGDVADLLAYQDTDLTAHDLAIRDLQVTGDSAPTKDEMMDPTKPTVRLINGQVDPVITMRPGETQLWRIGNIGSDMFYDVALDGHQFTVVGEDGNPVGDAWKTNHLVLPPGKRFEVLVQGGEAGTYPLKTLKYDQGFMSVPDAEIAKVEVSGESEDPLPLPSTVGSFTDLATAKIAAHRIEVFSFGPGKEFKPEINGKLFNEDVVNVHAKLGTVEEWTLKNTTSEEHPFHIHVNDFEVMSVNGRPYHAHGYQDTVLIPVDGEVVMRMPLDDYPGKFVFHCHILGHEDAGMMAVIQVE